MAWADAVDDHGAAFVETMLVDRLAALLVHPSGEALVREAAHLAAEAVAERRLQETLLWLRAVREAERVSGRIDWAPAGRDRVDAFRATYLHGLVAELERSAAAEDEPEPADGGGDRDASFAPCRLDRAK